jgi:hypothetical protein
VKFFATIFFNSNNHGDYILKIAEENLKNTPLKIAKQFLKIAIFKVFEKIKNIVFKVLF